MQKAEFFLNRLNQTYRIRMKNLTPYQLLYEILPSEDEISLIGMYLGKCWLFGNIDELLIEYKETISIFLVGCAFYHYNDREGGFWNSVGEQIGITCSVHQWMVLHRAFFRAFIHTLNIYKLPLFEDEARNGYHYITPILCHSGIPTNCLPSLFEKIVQTLEDRSFSYGNSTDKFLYLCRYGANLPVLRYIRHLQVHGESDNWLAECRDLLSTLARQQQPHDESLYNAMSPIFVKTAENWLKQHTHESRTIQKGVQYETPSLRLDTEQMRVYVDLPQQKLRGAQGSLLWSVFCGNQTKLVKRSAVMNANQSWYAPYSLMLEEPGELSVHLQVEIDGEKAEQNWALFGDKDTHIVFGRAGKQQRTVYLSAGLVYLMVHEGTKLREFDRINNEHSLGDRCSILTVNTKDIGELSILTPDGHQHVLVVKAQPVLQGNHLFGLEDNCGIDYPLYEETPILVLPQGSVDSWQLECRNIHTDELYSAMIPNGGTQSLSNMLQQIGGYGCFRVIAASKQWGTHQYSFAVLPPIKLNNFNLWYWPYSEGYQPFELKFLAPENVLVIPYDVIADAMHILAETSEFYGKVLFKDHEYPFVLRLRPYSFQFTDNDGNIFGHTNRTNTFTLRDLCKIPDITLSISRGDANNSLRGRLVLISDGEERQVVSFRLLVHNDLPMKVFLDTINNLQTDHASLQLFIEERIPVQIALIRLDATVTDLEAKSIQNGWLLQWQESGPGRGRDLILLSMLCPWKPKRLTLEDHQSWTVLEAIDVPWPGPFFVWVATTQVEDLFGTTPRGIIEPDGEATLLISRQQDSYMPIDKFSCFFNDCITASHSAAWHASVGKLQITSLTGAHMKKLIDALLLLRRNQKRLEPFYNISCIEEGLLYSIKTLSSTLGWQTIIEALFAADASAEEFQYVVSTTGIDFPTTNGKAQLTQNAWEYVLKIDMQLALLTAFCDRSPERFQSYFMLLLNDHGLSDRDVWNAANADIVFMDRSREEFLQEAAKVLSTTTDRLRICNAATMVGFIAQLIKHYATNGMLSQSLHLLRKWTSTLCYRYRKTWISKLANVLLR